MLNRQKRCEIANLEEFSIENLRKPYNGCPRVFVLSSSIQLRNPTSFSALEIILLVRVKSKYAILTILEEYLQFSRFHTYFFNPPEKAHRRLEVQLIILLK